MTTEPSSLMSTNTHQETANRRLTRSTYVGDPHHPESGPGSSRRKRSASEDSENAWIPPPPLLPLNTRFLITDLPPSCISPTTIIHQPISDLASAHLKCPSPLPPGLVRPSPSFRLLIEGELLSHKRSRVMGEEEEEIAGERLRQDITRRHRGPEMLERRCKRLEKERLVHERFKLQAHLNLLRNPSGADWKSVRGLTLRRIKEEERTGTRRDESSQIEKEVEKVERMRWVMIREAQETLKRYEKLLDTRKHLKPKPPPPTSEHSLEMSSVHEHITPSSPPAPPPHPSIRPSGSRSRPPPGPEPVRRRRPVRPKAPVSDEPSSLSTHRPLRISLKLKPLRSEDECDVKPDEATCWKSRRECSGVCSSERGVEEEEAMGDEDGWTANALAEVKERGEVDEAVEGSRRESLYESRGLRRMILEEGGRRHMGRVAYAFGQRLPDLNQIKWSSYGLRVESMALEQGLVTSPFKLGCSIREILNSRLEIDEQGSRKEEGLSGECIGKDWIEFNPMLNEEKRLAQRRDEYGDGSKFFEVLEELSCVEREMEERGEGSSMRRLIGSRVLGKRDDDDEKDR